MVSDSGVPDPRVSETGSYYLVKGIKAGGSALWRALINGFKPGRVKVKAIGLHSRASMYLIPADFFNPENVWGFVIVYARIENPDFSQWCRHLECRDLEIEVRKVRVRDEWGIEITTKYVIIRDLTNNREYTIYPNYRIRDLIVSETVRSRATESETEPGPITFSETVAACSHRIRNYRIHVV